MSNGWACVLRCGGIGDNLIASSVLPGLRAKYGKVEVISRAPGAVVFENNPHIDKLTVWPEDEQPTDAVTWARYIAKRGREYDAFFHLSHSCEISLALMEGQTAFWWPDKARRRLCGHSYLSFVHDLCEMPHDFAPEFFPTEAEMTQAWDTRNTVLSSKPGKRGPVIGWCLAGSRIDKLYPHSAFVIARLIVELDASVIMFGAPTEKEKQMAQAIQDQVKVQNGSDAGLHAALSPDPKNPSWPVRRVLAQARLCDLVVSPDTGPAWGVAMLPMPKVILISHTSVTNITHGWCNTVALHADQGRVPCWPCHRLHDTWDTCKKAGGLEAAACMADIPSDAVMRAVRRGLAGLPGAAARG